MTGAVERTRWSEPSHVPHRISPSLLLAACLIVGVWLAEQVGVSAWCWLLVCGGSCLSAWGVRRQRLCGGLWLLSVAALTLGAALWMVRAGTSDATSIVRLVGKSRDTVSVEGVIGNIPSLRSRRDNAGYPDGDFGRQQTLFLLDAAAVVSGSDRIPVTGRLRVLVDGAGASQLNWGERVVVTGRLESEFRVSNPGEFDFAAFLRRQSIVAVMFVGHPLAVVPCSSVSRGWPPVMVLSRLRHQAAALMHRHLSSDMRPLAEALLLGNRGHLDADTEREFVESGTMHLLSISGLHVGILYVFLVRVLSGLLISRRRCMLLGLAFCVAYALLTDLRPSVVRSAVFIVLSVVAQLLRRNVNMQTLIGNTASVLVLADPGVVFDTGAWLSFLAVGALGWASETSDGSGERTAPPDSLTWREHLLEHLTSFRKQLRLRYRQMFAVTVFSMPLVAAQFHVVSLSGIVVNLLLIPLTGCAMISGFVFIGSGLLLPAAAALTAPVFNSFLLAVAWSVEWSAGLPFGALTIPDLPIWFLPAYYLLLLVILIAGSGRIARGSWAALGLLVLAGFWHVNQPVHRDELICTVLSVGHGNAVVVESPDGRTVLFDAGAMHRGERTADLIARFLWHQGHRMLDAVVISHADSDHYNAVSGLTDRLPVGQVLTTSELTSAAAEPVRHLLQNLADRQIDIRQVFDGDRLEFGGVTVEFRKASSDGTSRLDDNELSLVSVLTFAGRSIALPGDLERRGASQLRDVLPDVDILVSPHHGSRVSNTEETAQIFAPETVIVSARSADTSDTLKEIYGAAAQLLNTSEVGAVTVRISEDSRVATTAWLQKRL